MSKNIKSFNLEEIADAKVTVELELSMIEVDYEGKSPTGYQREPKASDIKKMTEDFVPEACRHLLVGQRKDGRYFCVDGNHERITLMKLGVEKWMCEVFQSSGPALEAKVFAIVNKKRRSVSAWNTHRAMVISEDEEAIDLVQIVESAGFRLALKGSWPSIICIGALTKSYGYDKGVSLLSALKHISEQWLQEEDALIAQMVEGLTLFIHRTGDRLDHRRLGNLMSKVSPREIIRKTSSRFPKGSMSGGRGAYVSMAIAEYYNRRLKESNRINFEKKG